MSGQKTPINGRQWPRAASPSDVLLQHVDLGRASSVIHVHEERWSTHDRLAIGFALVSTLAFTTLLLVGGLEAPVWIGFAVWGVQAAAVIGGVVTITLAIRAHRRASA